jgi:hypothetical protein
MEEARGFANGDRQERGGGEGEERQRVERHRLAAACGLERN